MPDMFPELLRLATIIDGVVLNEIMDAMRWHFSESGEYKGKGRATGKCCFSFMVGRTVMCSLFQKP